MSWAPAAVNRANDHVLAGQTGGNVANPALISDSGRGHFEDHLLRADPLLFLGKRARHALPRAVPRPRPSWSRNNFLRAGCRILRLAARLRWLRLLPARALFVLGRCSCPSDWRS